MEAGAGIEPTCTVLHTVTWPLGHPAFDFPYYNYYFKRLLQSSQRFFVIRFVLDCADQFHVFYRIVAVEHDYGACGNAD